MTALEKLFWQRLQRRVAALEPEVARAILRAFAILRDEVSESEFTALVARGDLGEIERRFNAVVLDKAMAPVRRAIYTQTVDGVVYHGRDIPKAKGLGIQFNVLNPRMVDAVKALDTKVVQGMATDLRATLRQVAQRGIEAGTNPRVVARELRASIGLGPTQEGWVQKFRQALIDRDVAKIRTYRLRDKRFDSRIARGDYGDAEIEKWTDRFRRSHIAHNAETLARTATLDAQKLAQRMAWESAIERGIVNRAEVMKRWVGTLDDRERPAHLAMEGETVQFDEQFSNGQQIPGDTEYNCRCLARYGTHLKRQAAKPVRRTPQQLAAARASRQGAASPVPVGRSLASPPPPPSTPPPPPVPPARTPPPAPNARRRERALRTEEKRIRSAPIEHALAVDAAGNTVLRKSGGRSSIQFTAAEQARLANTHMTHNHPRGSWGLSLADGRFAVSTNVAEIRAVTVDQVSILLRPNNGWVVTTGQLSRVHANASRVVRQQLDAQLAAGLITVPQYNQRFGYDIWVLVAKHFGWNFSSVATP